MKHPGVSSFMKHCVKRKCELLRQSMLRQAIASMSRDAAAQALFQIRNAAPIAMLRTILSLHFLKLIC